MCVLVYCLYVCDWWTWRTEEELTTPGAVGRDCSELPCDCWEQNLHDLKKQVLLSSVPSVQSQTRLFLFCYFVSFFPDRASMCNIPDYSRVCFVDLTALEVTEIYLCLPSQATGLKVCSITFSSKTSLLMLFEMESRNILCELELQRHPRCPL